MPAKMLNQQTPEPPVRRFLRHRGSQEYFKDGGWTSNLHEATSFADIVEAAETCSRYELSDVELAIRFDTSAGDVFCTRIR